MSQGEFFAAGTFGKAEDEFMPKQGARQKYEDSLDYNTTSKYPRKQGFLRSVRFSKAGIAANKKLFITDHSRWSSRNKVWIDGTGTNENLEIFADNIWWRYNRVPLESFRDYYTDEARFEAESKLKKARGAARHSGEGLAQYNEALMSPKEGKSHASIVESILINVSADYATVSLDELSRIIKILRENNNLTAAFYDNSKNCDIISKVSAEDFIHYVNRSFDLNSPGIRLNIKNLADDIEKFRFDVLESKIKALRLINEEIDIEGKSFLVVLQEKDNYNIKLGNEEIDVLICIDTGDRKWIHESNQNGDKGRKMFDREGSRACKLDDFKTDSEQFFSKVMTEVGSYIESKKSEIAEFLQDKFSDDVKLFCIKDSAEYRNIVEIELGGSKVAEIFVSEWGNFSLSTIEKPEWREISKKDSEFEAVIDYLKLLEEIAKQKDILRKQLQLFDNKLTALEDLGVNVDKVQSPKESTFAFQSNIAFQSNKIKKSIIDGKVHWSYNEKDCTILALNIFLQENIAKEHHDIEFIEYFKNFIEIQKTLKEDSPEKLIIGDLVDDDLYYGSAIYGSHEPGDKSDVIYIAIDKASGDIKYYVNDNKKEANLDQIKDVIGEMIQANRDFAQQKKQESAAGEGQKQPTVKPKVASAQKPKEAGPRRRRKLPQAPNMNSGGGASR